MQVTARIAHIIPPWSLAPAYRTKAVWTSTMAEAVGEKASARRGAVFFLINPTEVPISDTLAFLSTPRVLSLLQRHIVFFMIPYCCLSVDIRW